LVGVSTCPFHLSEIPFPISGIFISFLVLLVYNIHIAAVHDGRGDGELVLCWFCFDILCQRKPALRQKNPRRQPSSRSAGCGGVCGAASVTERGVDVFTSTLQGLLFPIPQSPLHIVPTVKAIRTQII
jgi:hypothetical protein